MSAEPTCRCSGEIGAAQGWTCSGRPVASFLVSYLTGYELSKMGIRAGRDVRVSVDARLFGPERIVFGDNVRVDAFCVVSAGRSGFVEFNNHIHIASGVRLFGDAGITLSDFSTVSAGSTVYSASDDYSGRSLIGPTIPETFTSVDRRPVRLEPFSAIGAHALVLPGVTFGEGAVLGAGGMATVDLASWTVFVGAPCRALRERDRALVALAADFTAEWASPEG